MTLQEIPGTFSVCQVRRLPDRLPRWSFAAATDEELSLVCRTDDAPADAVQRDDGWRAFRVEGVLDFSLIGILARLSEVLAEAGIGLFAVSTYNTDYILTKADQYEAALAALARAGYAVERCADETK